MIKLRLNQNYPNDFLTTQSGKIFYRKDNTLGRPESIIELEKTNPEIDNLISQNYLVEVKDEPVESVPEKEKKPSKKDPDLITGKGLNSSKM